MIILKSHKSIPVNIYSFLHHVFFLFTLMLFIQAIVTSCKTINSSDFLFKNKGISPESAKDLLESNVNELIKDINRCNHLGFSSSTRKKYRKFWDKTYRFDRQARSLLFINKIRLDEINQVIEYPKNINEYSKIIQQIVQKEKLILLNKYDLLYDTINYEPVNFLNTIVRRETTPTEKMIFDWIAKLEAYYYDLSELETNASLANKVLANNEIILLPTKNRDDKNMLGKHLEVSNQQLKVLHEQIKQFEYKIISKYANTGSFEINGLGNLPLELQLFRGEIDQIQGKAICIIPDSMHVNIISKVTLSISGKDKEAFLLEKIKEQNKSENDSKLKEISIGRIMRATLTDPLNEITPKFYITPLFNKEEQLIDLYNRKTIDWTWNVIPLEVGKHELNLTLEVIVKNDLGEHSYTIPIFNEKVIIFRLWTLFQPCPSGRLKICANM